MLPLYMPQRACVIYLTGMLAQVILGSARKHRVINRVAACAAPYTFPRCRTSSCRRADAFAITRCCTIGRIYRTALRAASHCAQRQRTTA